MTEGTTIASKSMRMRHVALAAALLLPVSLGGPALAEETLSEASFESGFAHVAIPQPEAEVAIGAVDITAIEVPIEEEPAATLLGNGIASYYGKRFHGRPTASGQKFDMNAYTAAHRTLPFGSQVRVTNPRNGKSVVVTINDRGPYAHGRTIDLSRAAATEVGLIRRGHGEVQLELISG